MSKPENSFIAGVHRYVQCYAEKMANPYRGGTPDVWYSGRKGDLWVEYKFIVVPKRSTTVIVPNLSALQLEWLKNRKAEGRRVAVVVGCKAGAVMLVDERHWEEGIRVADFKALLMSRSTLAETIDSLVS